MNRHLAPLFSLFVMLALLAACSSDPVQPVPPGPTPTPSPIVPAPTPTPTPTPTPGDTISGTVSGPGDVSSTVVYAFLNGQSLTSQSFTDASGTYTLTGLSTGSYQIVAWKDVNANQDPDNGDYLGIYAQGGAVSPPATGIDIAMEVISEGPSPTPDPNPTPTPTPTPGTGISGTVTALPGSDIAGTLVGACPVIGQDADCQNIAARVEIVQSGPSAPYTLDVPAGQYAIVAAQDSNLDGSYTIVGAYSTFVTPPASGIDFQIEVTTPSSFDSSGISIDVSGLNFSEFQGLLE